MCLHARVCACVHAIEGMWKSENNLSSLLAYGSREFTACGQAWRQAPYQLAISPAPFCLCVCICMYAHGYPRTTFGNWVSPSIVGSGDRTKQDVRQVIFTFMHLLTGPQHFHFQMPDPFDQ